MASLLPQFTFSSADVKRVRRVQFGVLSPEEIKAMSVVEVTKPATYVNGLAVRGGLDDPLLGSNDLRTTCATCKSGFAGSEMVNDWCVWDGRGGNYPVRRRPLVCVADAFPCVCAALQCIASRYTALISPPLHPSPFPIQPRPLWPH